MAIKEFQLGDTPVTVNAEWFPCEGVMAFQTLINLEIENGGQIDFGSQRLTVSTLRSFTQDSHDPSSNWGVILDVQGSPTQEQLVQIVTFVQEVYDNGKPNINPKLDYYGI